MDVCIQIGNTDNKLTQREWAGFIEQLYCSCVESGTVHFSGGSSPEKPWQNYCFCVSDVKDKNKLEAAVTRIRTMYDQDSVSFLAGDCRFV